MTLYSFSFPSMEYNADQLTIVLPGNIGCKVSTHFTSSIIEPYYMMLSQPQHLLFLFFFLAGIYKYFY